MLRNVPNISVMSRIDSFQSEALTIIDAMTTTPNVTRQRLINELVSGLKDDSLWPGKDCYYIMAAHTNDNGEAQINWKNPGTFDLILVNNPAFEVDRGFTGNGVNQYINTQYNPSTDAINYALNSASIGIYVRTDINEAATDINAGSSAPNTRIGIASRWNNVFGIRVNNEGNNNVANLDSRGMFIAIRNNSTNIEGYKNKSLEIDVAENSVGIPNENIYIFCNNASGVTGNFSSKQIASALVGSGMTQTNVNNETDRIETFADAVGFGVIP